MRDLEEEGKGRREEGRARALWLPKAGSRAEEYEDAFAFSAEGTWPFRAAVADGATESAFARRWAEQLARGYMASGGWTALPAWQEAWRQAVAARAEALPWYAEAKAAEGAFAAALGLTLEDGGTWRATAVGDCCLFHLRDGGEERLRWPLAAPDAFGSRPALLPSRPERAMPALRTCAGTYGPGDAFLLATDAVAAWLMRTGPARALGFDEAVFRVEVEEARASGALRNDDATLLVLRA